MARYAIHGTCRDGEGNVISGATIQAYLADTTTIPTIYAAKTGGSAIASGQVTSATDGTWSFYVDDGDYAVITLFDLVVSHSDHDTQNLYDVWGS